MRALTLTQPLDLDAIEWRARMATAGPWESVPREGAGCTPPRLPLPKVGERLRVVRALGDGTGQVVRWAPVFQFTPPCEGRRQLGTRTLHHDAKGWFVLETEAPPPC